MESLRVDDGCKRASELETPFAGAVGDRRDSAVVAVPAAVEDAARYPGAPGPLREQLPSALRLLHRVEVPQLGLRPGDSRQSAAGVVIDQLGEDAAIGAVDGEPRPISVAAHLGAHPPAATQPVLWLGQDGHQALFPTLRATCSP